MKNLILGLVLGAALTTLGAYLSFPKFKEKAFNEGVEHGKKQGAEEAKAAGITEGIVQGQEQAKAAMQKSQDSLVQALHKAEQAKKVVHKVVEPKPQIQNWRVLGGQIAEPILENGETNSTSTDKKASTEESNE